MRGNLRLQIFLGQRLSLGADGSKSAPAVKVAVAAVAISIAVMLASIAIVNGFKHEIRQKVVGFNSHLTIYVDPQSLNENEQPLVSMTPTLKKILNETPFIKSYTLEASSPSLLKTIDNFKGVYFKGVDNISCTDFIKYNIVDGAIPTNNQDSSLFVIISSKAAEKLNLKCGMNVDTYFITDNIKVRPLKIAAIYNSHFDVYDDINVFGSLRLVQEIAGLQEHEGSAIRIITDDFERIEEYRTSLNKRLEEAYVSREIYKHYNIESVNNQGMGYFQWLSLLDTNVLVILILMAIVSCVTLISGVLIIILDKYNFIGTIKALGACNSSVRGVFVYLSMKVALTGIVIGNVFMLILLWLQQRYHFLPLDPDNYYIDFVPVNLYPQAIITLNMAVIVMIFFVLVGTASFVSRIRPASSLRYE
ncbi:MAG: ABC transporter permease [Prevotella sp.]|nr:ABC transporter permease [Bacteroides sp.]MCM1365638.1 ABC transporter permease [Prevotella sp.]